MKKFPFFIAVAILFASCFKDECTSLRTIYYPVYETLTKVRSDMKSTAPETLNHTGKIYLYGNYIFLTEINKGIHIIDNTDPSKPENISFIPVPGNEDIAVKENYLYADSYSDLVVFDIHDPKNVHAVKFLNNTFPDKNNYYWNSSDPDSIMLVTDWVAKDTLIDCATYYNIQSASGAYQVRPGLFLSATNPGVMNNAGGGTGGSMARFALLNQYLYTVSYSNLSSFNVSDAANPEFKTSSQIANWSIETIYPFKDKLFIGSQNGMYIFGVTDPVNPQQLGMSTHVRTCDPVIADDANAYVTLRSGTACSGFTNQLEIMDIADMVNPTVLKTYQMTNPRGLSKDNNILFICDEHILKVYNSADINDLQLLSQVNIPETFDVIVQNNIAIVIAKDGLYQFDYSDPASLKELSKISIQ